MYNQQGAAKYDNSISKEVHEKLCSEYGPDYIKVLKREKDTFRSQISNNKENVISKKEGNVTYVDFGYSNNPNANKEIEEQRRKHGSLTKIKTGPDDVLEDVTEIIY